MNHSPTAGSLVVVQPPKTASILPAASARYAWLGSRQIEAIENLLEGHHRRGNWFEEERRMFGTIGHIRIKPGHEEALRDLMDEWNETIRPHVPGPFLNLYGRSVGRAGESMFVALAQDESTYRQLAEMPRQDAWYRTLLEHIEGEPAWEDVELEQLPA